MESTRTNWDWYWIRLKNTLYNGRYEKNIAIVFKKKLEETLDKGYPIDYIPINHRIGDDYNLLLYTIKLLSISSNSGIGERLANLLLDKGADVNVLSRRGETALIVLAAKAADGGKNYSDDFWKRIISQTKDIDAKDYIGYSALDYLGIRYVNMFGTPRDLELNKSNSPYIFSRIKMLLDNGADPERAIQTVRNYAGGLFLNNKDIHKAAAEEVVGYITEYMEHKEQVNSHQMCDYDYELSL